MFVCLFICDSVYIEVIFVYVERVTCIRMLQFLFVFVFYAFLYACCICVVCFCLCISVVFLFV